MATGRERQMTAGGRGEYSGFFSNLTNLGQGAPSSSTVPVVWLNHCNLGDQTTTGALLLFML